MKDSDDLAPSDTDSSNVHDETREELFARLDVGAGENFGANITDILEHDVMMEMKPDKKSALAKPVLTCNPRHSRQGRRDEGYQLCITIDHESLDFLEFVSKHIY